MFGFAVTNLIQDLYPRLRVGPASVRRYGIIALDLVSHCGHTESERLC